MMRRRNQSRPTNTTAVVILVAVILALAATALIVGLLVFLRPAQEVAVNPKPVQMTVIPASTLTPIIVVTPLVTPTATRLAPGEIGKGIYVRVTGTNGVGLNFRSEPGTKGTILFLGMEAEVFLVKDGPREVDGYIWWQLQAPYDQTRNGWAAKDYLVPVQNP
jgi:hypothetical protein